MIASDDGEGTAFLMLRRIELVTKLMRDSLDGTPLTMRRILLLLALILLAAPCPSYAQSIHPEESTIRVAWFPTGLTLVVEFWVGRRFPVHHEAWMYYGGASVKLVAREREWYSGYRLTPHWYRVAD